MRVMTTEHFQLMKAASLVLAITLLISEVILKSQMQLSNWSLLTKTLPSNISYKTITKKGLSGFFHCSALLCDRHFPLLLRCHIKHYYNSSSPFSENFPFYIFTDLAQRCNFHAVSHLELVVCTVLTALPSSFHILSEWCLLKKRRNKYMLFGNSTFKSLHQAHSVSNIHILSGERV